jgi:hypothetical protein
MGDIDILLLAAALLGQTLVDRAPTLEVERIEALVTEGIEIAVRTRQPSQESWLRGIAGYLDAMLGRLEAARAQLEPGLAAVESITHNTWIGVNARVQAAICVRMGDIEAAERLLRTARAAGAPAWGQVDVLGGMVEVAIASARGDTERAVAAARTVAGSGGWPGFLDMKECALFDAARALREHGDAGGARIARSALRELATFKPRAEPFVLWIEALEHEDAAERAAGLREAGTLMRQHLWRVEEARCLLDLARAEGSLGRDPLPDLKAARELLLRCGAGLYVKDADAALAAYA